MLRKIVYVSIILGTGVRLRLNQIKSRLSSQARFGSDQAGIRVLLATIVFVVVYLGR